jgi:hypothetical protein
MLKELTYKDWITWPFIIVFVWLLVLPLLLYIHNKWKRYHKHVHVI